jgi:TRAP-type C4-dicarboxylate transport system substrate-binding protein
MKKIALAAAAAVIAALPLAASADSPHVITLRLGGDQNPLSPTAKSDAYFAEQVKKFSNGSVQVNLYESGQLGNQEDQLGQAETGSLDFIDVATFDISGDIKALGIFDFPFLATTQAAAVNMATNDKVLSYIRKALQQRQVRLLGILAAGPIALQAKKPIRVPADLKEYKVRTVTNPITVATFRQLGAIVTPMPPLQVYSALQQNVIEGATVSYEYDLSQGKWYEQAKYMSLLPSQFLFQLVAMSDRSWSKLSPLQQEAISKAANAQIAYNTKVEPDALAATLAGLKKAGAIPVHPDVSLFVKAVAPIQQQYAASVGEGLYQAAKAITTQ